MLMKIDKAGLEQFHLLLAIISMPRHISDARDASLHPK